MTERELLEQLLNEVKELKTAQNEMKATQDEMKIAQCDISERLDAVNMKCDITRKKVDDLALDMKLMERGIRTDIRKLQDTTETIVVVLQGQITAQSTVKVEDSAAVRKIYFQLLRPFFALLYGAEGNRTPVRKPLHCGISHHSHFFDIPSIRRQMTGC